MDKVDTHYMPKSNCKTKWADMTGDNVSRLCPDCKALTFDLSNIDELENDMTKHIEQLSSQPALFRRDDGRVTVGRFRCSPLPAGKWVWITYAILLPFITVLSIKILILASSTFRQALWGVFCTSLPWFMAGVVFVGLAHTFKQRCIRALWLVLPTLLIPTSLVVGYSCAIVLRYGFACLLRMVQA